MKQFKKFWDSYFDEQFLSECIALALLSVVFVCVQSFTFWIGEFSSVGRNFGRWLDAILALIVWLPMLYLSLQDKEDKYRVQVFCLLVTGGIFLNVILLCHWDILIVLLALLAICLILAEISSFYYLETLYPFVGCYLLFAVCTYISMRLNDLRVAMSVSQFAVLAGFSLIVWFRPCLHWKSEC